MNLRSNVFWRLDNLTGGDRLAELRDTQLLNSRVPGVTERRVELLNTLIAYVKDNVPYYRNFGRIDKLQDLPVLNKEQIRKQQSHMVAIGVDHSRAHVASTSGSTGMPFRVYHDVRKRRRSDADAMYFGELAGYKIGSPLFYLKLWTGRSSKGRLNNFLRNTHQIDVSRFSAREVSNLIDSIESVAAPSSIIGHSSSLETIAKTLRSHHQAVRDVEIAAIVGQAEPLAEEAREALYQNFGVYPVARYGMEELGILGQQATGPDGAYRLNMASHVVELLQLESDRPAARGALGRIVVTDLFNRAQPMVRYDTGDLGVARVYEEETGYVDVLERLEGRTRERLYDVNDEPLSPLIAYNFWWMFPDILHYQMVQYDRGRYQLRLNVEGRFSAENRLISEFRKQVGQTADVEVVYSSSDFWYASGKRKSIVSHYTPGSSSVDD